MYVFADESGDDRFDREGSRYFTIAAYMTRTPLIGARAVHSLLYDLQGEGTVRRTRSRKKAAGRGEPYSTLHATYDHPDVRRRAFALIDSLAGRCGVYVAYLDKTKMNPAIRSKEQMYLITARAVARYVLKTVSDVDRVVFAFDQALNNAEMKAFKRAVKPDLAKIGVPYLLMFHQLGHEPNGQISDYIAWAVSRDLERGDRSALDAMPQIMKRAELFDLYKLGTTVYYTK